MGDPKKDKKTKDTKEKEPQEEESKGPSLDFLKPDRSLRPDGFHFAAEMGGTPR